MFNSESWSKLSEQAYGYKTEKFSYNGFDIFYSHVKNDIGEYLIAPSFGDFISVDKDNFESLDQFVESNSCAANGNPTAKIWDYNNFIELFEKLKNDCPQIPIIIIGDKGDHDMYINGISWPKYVVNTASKTDLGEMICLIRNARCVVAHDSGIMHIANALDVRLIALYGPTDYTWTKPMGENTEIIYSRNKAFACMYNEKIGERESYKKYPEFYAMSDISVDSVFEKIQNIL